MGRWRLANNASNDHGIDREAQRTQSFTGIDGIHLQDQAITESMGPIIDRSIEHLGSSDAMVIRTRRCLMRAAQALRDTGAPRLASTIPSYTDNAPAASFCHAQRIGWRPRKSCVRPLSNTLRWCEVGREGRKHAEH